MVNDTIIIVLIKKWRVFGMVDYLFHEFAEDYLVFLKKKKLGDIIKCELHLTFFFPHPSCGKIFLAVSTNFYGYNLIVF